jgi:regulator of protease activity HflC (stomatin/prohibitin superfamily)
MADITTRAFVRHLRGTPTTWIRHQRRGTVAHEGVAQSFWYRPLTATLSEVPVDDRELPLLFHARTADFQDVATQATVTYRVADPARAAARIDFGVDPDTGAWRATPLDQVAGLLTELAQQYAVEVLARTPLQVAVTDGLPLVRDRVAAGLADDPRLTETGLEVVAVRVVAVRAEREVEKALQTPMREQVQQEADRATYERRAEAVNRERAIAENELQNQIELAKREEQLVAQRGANEQRRATEAAAAAQVEAAARAERDRLEAQVQSERERLLAGARAEAVRLVGVAEGEAEEARIAAYRDLEAATLLGLAVRELAGNLPAIGQLNLTPDLLTGFLARLATPTETGPVAA